MNIENQNHYDHKFKSNETISGAIKLYNGYQLHEAEMILLLQYYNELNNNEVPKPGQIVKIPRWTLGTCLYHVTNT
jgi:hypothetical protein